MAKVVLTRKLKAAIDILASERYSDCTEEAFVVALRKGKITVEQIYKIMQSMRYQWKPLKDYWIWKPLYMRSVLHVFDIVQKEDEPIVARMMKEM